MIEYAEALSVRSGTGDDQGLSETRFWMGAGEPVGRFAIDLWHCFHSELREVRPFVADENLMIEEIARVDDPAGVVEGLLRCVFDEADGAGESESANADIDDPGLVINADLEE